MHLLTMLNALCNVKFFSEPEIFEALCTKAKRKFEFPALLHRPFMALLVN